MFRAVLKVIVGALIAFPGLLVAGGPAGSLPVLSATIVSIMIVGGCCILAWGVHELTSKKKANP